LPGSSARKLRRSGVTNLAGRLRSHFLCPLTFSEIDDFDLLKYLQFGGLPPIWRDEDPALALRDYCGEYLKEEIQAEGITRNLAGFTRFLEISAAQNGQLVNFTSIGRDSGVSAKTVHEYYQVLVDTLMGFLLEPWIWTKKRRAIRTPKFYWFDCGIPHSHINRTLSAKTPEFGQSFEHFIVPETMAALRYERKFSKIHYWRSAAG
jgi:predicted AAA+ superfamily ATPase